MQIDPKVLAEINYTGSRLIEIDNPKLSELQKELSAYQQEINPIIDMLSAEYYPVIDPMYQKVQELNAEAKAIKEKIAEQTAMHKKSIEAIEAAEQKAGLIKNKMQPLILKEVEGKLSEFEIARNTVIKDEKIYVEVFDEIEEKVKALRTAKAKK